MARRRIFWHIGPDDLGTGYLAHALDVRREELAEAGVLVPGTPAAWELATVELRQNHQQLGYRRREVTGQCAALARLGWRHRGVTVLSTPGLAGATADQVALALDGLRGAEIHLVLVVRDLTSQVYAGAQAALEQGATTRPKRYAQRVLTDPDHSQARAFRAGHDVADILRRWTRTVLPDQVHVIAETEPALVWERLMTLVGAEAEFAPDAMPAAAHADRLATLREVALGLDDRLDARGRRTALRDWLGRDLLTGTTATTYPPVPGAEWLATWAEYVTRKGFDMHGEFRVSEDARAQAPVTAEGSASSALADAVVEVARLRAEVADLQALNTRLDRKRRKHKSRLRLSSGRDVA